MTAPDRSATGQVTTSDGFARLLQAVAAHGLPGSELSLDGAPLDPGYWGMLLAQVRAQQLTGHLAAAVTSAALSASPEQAEQASQAHERAMTTVLRLEALLVRCTEMLGAVGVQHRALKGIATSHLDYPDPALRSFADIDVLIRSADMERAIEVLSGAGFLRRYPEPRRGFDRRFGKGVALVGPGELEIDLHRTLALGSFGLTLDLDDLWAGTEPLSLGDRTLHALDRDRRFLHACYHAALGDPVPRLSALRDIAQMLRCVDQPPDVEVVLRLAARWGGEAVVARAVRLTWEAFHLSPASIASWATQRAATPRDDRALRPYTDPDLGSAARSWSAVQAIPGWRDRVVYLGSLAVPSRTFVRGRRTTRLARWRAGLQAAVRARRRR